MNPLIPGAGDVFLATLFVLHAGLTVVALVALARASDKRYWPTIVLLSILVPIAGSIVALIALRRRAAHPREVITTP